MGILFQPGKMLLFYPYWKVEYCGRENKLENLGRDVINAT